MCSKLIVLLFIALASPKAFSSKGEAFALSKKWLKLLHYKKTFSGYKSRATRPEFFLSPEGRTNPVEELNQSLKSFRENPNLACRFPARHSLLMENFSLPKRPACKDLDEWKSSLSAGDLFLVYSTAYPSNPASLFGHTFLRFNRLKHGSRKSSKLLGYSLAFLAQTNPNDNTLVYSLKGLTGGYEGYLEVKPFYMDVGIYNNSESRDMWEYKIPLTDAQKDRLVFHVWEVLTNTTFTYFFLDENCSTYVLELLEAVVPSWNFESKNNLMVVPQVTLKDVVKTVGVHQKEFRPAIKRQIWKRMDLLSSASVEKVFSAQEDSSGIDDLNSADELDLLIDLWKFENYKKTGVLSLEAKENMNKTLLKRASLEEDSRELRLRGKNEFRSPEYGHDFARLSIGHRENPFISLRYGFHSFDDPFIGYDEKSYISFLELDGEFEDDSLKLDDFKLVEITSLQNFSWNYPHFSWNIFAGGRRHRRSDTTPKLLNMKGGFGLSLLRDDWQSFFFFNAIAHLDTARGESDLNPALEWGFKYSIQESLFILAEATYEYSFEEKNPFYGRLSTTYQLYRNIGIRFGAAYFSEGSRFELDSSVNFYY